VTFFLARISFWRLERFASGCSPESPTRQRGEGPLPRWRVGLHVLHPAAKRSRVKETGDQASAGADGPAARGRILILSPARVEGVGRQLDDFAVAVEVRGEVPKTTAT
jgi:hypothetical protein